MQAEVLSVGTELLLGQTVNTDTTIVAKALSMLGIDLLYAAVVGDNVKRLEKAVHDALERSDILITTGGLGPTGDDLTKETVAAAAGKALALHEPSYKRLMEYFARGGLSENQIKQAMLPEGCTVLQNDNGTAPGCAFQTAAGKLVVMLPGPPSELEPMLQNYAVPYLAQFQSAVIASHSVHVFGRGEAAVAEMIADLTENSNPTAAPYAKEGEMFVRVTAKAATQAEADALCAPVVEEIRRRVGSFVYSVGVDSLEALVVDALRAVGKTLATAESCTGGLLAKRIT
ncbi:MAG: CinA family nicotinamide mononucleotide deamidase-related protein, partial [Acutalibacteraceae bacterium]